VRASQIEVANDRRAEILREFKRRHTLPDGRRVEHVEVTPRVRRETGYKRSPWLELWRVTYAGGETREYMRLEPRALEADPSEDVGPCRRGHARTAAEKVSGCKTCRSERDRATYESRKAVAAEGGAHGS